MPVQRSEFLDPLWRRVALVAFCFAWTAWEAWNGETFWAVAFGAMAAYGAWSYLYEYGRAPPAAPKPDKETP